MALRILITAESIARRRTRLIAEVEEWFADAHDTIVGTRAPPNGRPLQHYTTVCRLEGKGVASMRRQISYETPRFRIRGSSATRNPSPSMFNDRTVMNIARPGKRDR